MKKYLFINSYSVSSYQINNHSRESTTILYAVDFFSIDMERKLYCFDIILQKKESNEVYRL